MSKMGAFILDVQTVVCDHYNEPLSTVEEQVRKVFANEPEWKQNYAIETAKAQYDEIMSDFDEFSRLIYSSGE
jgi:demethoxyubiquinone hydroxylase (CLK1/Coq7/Cat5 family)